MFMHIGFESAKIDALIDRKIIPIDPKKKIIIIFVVLIFPIVLVYFLIFSKNFDEIESIENKIKVSSEELDKVRRASRDLPKHEKTLQVPKRQNDCRYLRRARRLLWRRQHARARPIPGASLLRRVANCVPTAVAGYSAGTS